MTYVMKVDMIACDGRGVCAELLPERISLDDWGYPMIDPEPIGRELLLKDSYELANCLRGVSWPIDRQSQCLLLAARRGRGPACGSRSHRAAPRCRRCLPADR